jgi:hypothetical protein
MGGILLTFRGGILGQVDGLQARLNKGKPDLDAAAFVRSSPAFLRAVLSARSASPVLNWQAGFGGFAEELWARSNARAPPYCLACPQRTEMRCVMLNSFPKAEVSKALLPHRLGNLAGLSHGPTLFRRQLAMLATHVEQFNLLVLREGFGVLVGDEIAGLPLASLPEIDNGAVARMAACTDTDKTFHCCARMQEVAPRSSKPMVAGSIPAGCALQQPLGGYKLNRADDMMLFLPKLKGCFPLAPSRI